jgi:hypothetical protein
MPELYNIYTRMLYIKEFVAYVNQFIVNKSTYSINMLI